MEPFHPLRFPSLLLIILSHVSGYPTPTSGSLPIINSVVLLCVCSVIQNYQPYSGQIDIQTKLEWVICISEEIGANPDILNGLWSHFNSFLLIIFRAVPPGRRVPCVPLWQNATHDLLIIIVLVIVVIIMIIMIGRHIFPDSLLPLLAL